MTVQLEVTTENLLNAVAQMPDGEFDRFVEKAQKIRQKGKTKKQTVSNAEADLLHKINTIFLPEKRREYNKLYARFKDEDLKEGEYEKLLKLNDEFEMLNVKRIELIAALAKLRGQTLDEVMNFFELKIQNDE